MRRRQVFAQQTAEREAKEAAERAQSKPAQIARTTLSVKPTPQKAHTGGRKA